MILSRIKQRELHIWWANLRDFDLAVPVLWSVLAACERARAEQYHLLREKENYIIRHGMLRLLLASYTAQSPSSLNLAAGGREEPEARTSPAGGGVYFNMSHSGDMAVYGFAAACPVGVDVEHLQPISQCERIAREYFSQTEVENLMALPEEFRAKRFMDLWTRKEALLKATGVGPAGGKMRHHTCQAEPVRPNRKDLSQALHSSGGWCVRSFSPLAGYVAAVAYRKRNLDLICRGTPAFFRGNTRLHAPATRN